MRLHQLLKKVLVYGLLAVFLFWTLAPLYWAVATSLKTGGQLFNNPPIYVPNPVTLKNYQEAFGTTILATALLNTIKVALVSTPLSVALAALAAFGLARFRFRGQGVLRFSFLLVRMLPGMVVAIPLFLILRQFLLVDTLAGLILAYTAFNLPFNIWLLEGFFADIPAELQDAALVDGCSSWSMFWRIMVPIVAPGLAASAIFCLLLAWSEFTFALLLSYTERSQTFPLIIALFSTARRGTNFGAMAAAGTLALVPILIVSTIIQRYLVRGLTAGAVRG